jgi:hypothetical protein
MSVSFASIAIVVFIQQENTGYRNFKNKIGGQEMKLAENSSDPNSAIVTLRLNLSGLMEDCTTQLSSKHSVKMQAFEEFKACIKAISSASHRRNAFEMIDEFMVILDSPVKLAKEAEKMRFLQREQMITMQLALQSDMRAAQEKEQEQKEKEESGKKNLQKDLIRLRLEIQKKELARLIFDAKEKELQKDLLIVQEELQKKKVQKQIMDAERDLLELREEQTKKEFRRQFLASHGSA